MTSIDAKDLPLAGVKIVDFTHGVAGPYAVMLLADLGAEVWKIERPKRGDPTRYMNVSERFVADIPQSGGDYFLAINRNKKSVAIDLQSPEGVELALGLVEKADIAISNFRPGVMERLGLGYEDCQARNAGIIWASLSAYGESGPLAHQPGMDVAIQARSGVMSITGNGDGGPAKPGASVADFSGGAHLTIAVLSALVKRMVDGRGQKLHVSLLDSMMSMLMNYSVAVIDGQADIKPMGSGHPQLVPFQAFPTTDGSVVIATGTNRLFGQLCRTLGLPELIDDPRFVTNVTRVKHRDVLVNLISDVTDQQSTAHWIAQFEADGIPCSPVNTLAEAFAEEQLIAQGMITEIDHSEYGSVHVVSAPYTFSGERPGVLLPPPRLGANTAEVLGLEEEDFSRLLKVGVIGDGS